MDEELFSELSGNRGLEVSGSRPRLLSELALLSRTVDAQRLADASDAHPDVAGVRLVHRFEGVDVEVDGGQLVAGRRGPAVFMVGSWAVSGFQVGEG